MRIAAFAAAFAALIAGPALSQSRLRAFDVDKNGRIDLAEAKRAANATFDRLERDKDGTLSRKELRGRLSRQHWMTANPDKDGTLTREEYLAATERAFKRADIDGDGAIETKEFRTPKGRALMRLMK
ncbi:MAG: EF-hand domain-containing protein [Hyphomicrobiales bacterium]|nr:EF-hand domain-containing protein [Hyphomicrobiales bacterium]